MAAATPTPPRRSPTRAALLADGADILDIGGESTRPGAAPVAERDELARVLPVVAALAADGAIVSVDTTKPAVMRAAIDAGATMINDVRALAAPGALDAVAASDVAVCLMHMRGAPRTMQDAPDYVDVVAEVRAFLVAARAAACEAAGIGASGSCSIPGFGFGKTLAHNVSPAAFAAVSGGDRLSGARRPVAQVDAGRAHAAAPSASEWRRAWRRRWQPSRGARRSSASTTCARPSTRSRSGRRRRRYRAGHETTRRTMTERHYFGD